MKLSSIIISALTLETASSFLTPVPFTSSRQTSTHLPMAGRGGGPNRGRAPVEYKPKMNEDLPNYPQIRVVTPNPKGKDDPLGIMSCKEAMALAKEMGGLDLILMNENSDPPVCKIVDYSKYRYQQEKKKKELKKNSKATEVKEVKMSYKIDVHDYGVRKKSASKFLNQGNRVKCTVMFKGREIQHDQLGIELLNKLAEDMSDLCIMEGRPKREGRNLAVMMTPKPELVKKINEKKRAEEKAKRKEKEKSKVEFEAKQSAKAAASSTVAVATEVETETKLDLKSLDLGMNGDDDDDTDAMDELDDLLKGDDLTEKLFN